MSAVQDPSSATQAPPQSDPRRRRGRRGGRAVAAAVIVGVVVAGAVAIAVADPFGGHGRAASETAGSGAATALATVTRGTLSSQVNTSGTLGYAAQADGSSYQVIGQASGAYTELPAPGQVISCGGVLDRVANNPVVLVCGRTPAYRSLYEGDSGPDVRQLNRNLVTLGYASRAQLDPRSDYFGAETAYALERWQAKLGEDQTGYLALGQAVFLPGPLRIQTTSATLGALAGPGAPVASATSTNRQVQVQLDASEQSSVKVGDRAEITLPDNRITSGTVTRIGTVASSSPSSGTGGSGSGSSGATIPVYVTLRDPAAAAGLDQAPVQVQITTGGARNALIVPVDALLAQAGGGYAVETVNARGAHQIEPVTVGLFDDADGLVQVTSANLAAGDRVVVPST